MTGWRIVALADAGDMWWREAGDAADAVAGAHGGSFELLVVGDAAPAGEGWPTLSKMTLLRTQQVPETAAQLAAAAASLLQAPEKTLVLVPPGPFGEELAADLAARTGGHALGRSRLIELTDQGLRAVRSVFGGRAEVSMLYPAKPAFAAMRAEPRAGGADPLPEVTSIDIALPAADLILARTALSGRETPLEGARLVISGGRGLDSDGFALLGEIAKALGGAVGGSLPAVDAGLVPVSRQVGQSGKFVTPEIYVAFGLSGTPQHLAGIGPAARLVAVNSDATAPIFAYAELGAVADAREILPILRDILAEER